MHRHPCQDCGAPTECDGELLENYDGEPAVICAEFHLSSGTINAESLCGACLTKHEDATVADLRAQLGD